VVRHFVRDVGARVEDHMGQEPVAPGLAQELRTGLRRLAKAVVVVTAWDGRQRWAMTATAVSELSMDPPSLLVCVNRTASLYEPLSRGATFCINILRSDQQLISQTCSGAAKGEARFAEGQWGVGKCQTPYLQDAQASFFCRFERMLDYGTHAVVIGKVHEVIISGEVDPLVYVDGTYARVVGG
jgi:flavin reductase (DIM6/NTAB) family NADH-FMN oxidoreductase RutF